MPRFQPGALHPRWKGGKTKTEDGYIRITAGEDRGKYEHRLLWEKENGPIPDGHDVHHRNEMRMDNRVENIELQPAVFHRTQALHRYNTSKQRKRKDLTRSGHAF